jgi:ribosomal protein S18 acetylase RimI-like enzyme
LVVSRGVVHRPAGLPGFVAEGGGRQLGLATYHVGGSDCELVTLDAFEAGQGVGAALIGAVRAVAVAAGCERLWLITTNDNTHALRFYQRQGFVLAALHRDEISRSRLLKPEIPLAGNDGIPIRDEIEVEMRLRE